MPHPPGLRLKRLNESRQRPSPFSYPVSHIWQRFKHKNPAVLGADAEQSATGSLLHRVVIAQRQLICIDSFLLQQLFGASLCRAGHRHCRETHTLIINPEMHHVCTTGSYSRGDVIAQECQRRCALSKAFIIILDQAPRGANQVEGTAGQWSLPEEHEPHFVRFVKDLKPAAFELESLPFS